MTPSEAEFKVRNILADDFGIEFETLSPNTPIDSLNLDSLDFLDLMLKLGLVDQDVSHLHTIGEIADYLSS